MLRSMAMPKQRTHEYGRTVCVVLPLARYNCLAPSGEYTDGFSAGQHQNKRGLSKRPASTHPSSRPTLQTRVLRNICGVATIQVPHSIYSNPLPCPVLNSSPTSKPKRYQVDL